MTIDAPLSPAPAAPTALALPAEASPWRLSVAPMMDWTDRHCRFLHRLLSQGGMFYRNGSGALMLCYVAAGRLIGYYEPHINSWDCIAAVAIINAAETPLPQTSATTMPSTPGAAAK